MDGVSYPTSASLSAISRWSHPWAVDRALWEELLRKLAGTQFAIRFGLRFFAVEIQKNQSFARSERQMVGAKVGWPQLATYPQSPFPSRRAAAEGASKSEASLLTAM